jgi:predicted nucleic acid-binding protein
VVIILDTNVVSEPMKPVASPVVVAWMSAQTAGDLFITTITIAEILYGIEILPKGRRREQLFHEADATFEEAFAGRILSFNEQAARIFGGITVSRRTQGRPIGILDAQIAAIARAHGAILATRNTDDFEGCGLRLVNPWQVGS